MRIILAAAAAGAALAACESEEQLKERYRTELMSACSGRNGPGAAPPGFDVARFCACLVERTMAGRTVEDLAHLNSAAGTIAGREAATQCLRDQGLGGPPAARPTAPASNVADAQNVAAEAAQEATENTSE